MRTPQLHTPRLLLPMPNKVEPVPIQIRRIDQETPDGTTSDFLIVWAENQGRDCRFCAREDCTYADSDRLPGVGSCIIRRPSHDGSGPIPFLG